MVTTRLARTCAGDVRPLERRVAGHRGALEVRVGEVGLKEGRDKEGEDICVKKERRAGTQWSSGECSVPKQWWWWCGMHMALPIGS